MENHRLSLSVLSAPPLSSQAWPEFVQAAFQADHACYALPADRADFERLSSVMAAFPQGFKVYMAGSTPPDTPAGTL